MSEINMKWTLQAISSELDNQNFEIIDSTVLVGRHQNCNLVLQSSKISRKHAAFHIKDQQLWLEDLQSSNGTFINEIQIDRPTQLESDDVIQFADLQFRVLASNESTTYANEDTQNADVNDVAHESTHQQPAQSNDASVEQKQSVVKDHATEVQETPSKAPQQSSRMVGIVIFVVAIIIAFVVWSMSK